MVYQWVWLTLTKIKYEGGMSVVEARDIVQAGNERRSVRATSPGWTYSTQVCGRSPSSTAALDGRMACLAHLSTADVVLI